MEKTLPLSDDRLQPKIRQGADLGIVAVGSTTGEHVAQGFSAIRRPARSS